MKNDLQRTNVSELIYWISERHRIWLKREHGFNKPWSEDPIFQQWKFTNVYRQLDKGTIWLTKMLEGQKDTRLILFNTIWYRLFNYWEHAKDLGFIDSYARVAEYIKLRYRQSKQVFTGAYMTTGRPFEDKYITYLQAVKEFWEDIAEIEEACETNSMEAVWNALRPFYMVGKFVAYEITCDIRFSVLQDPPDRYTWSNLGPGAVRGLQRLGKEPTLSEMTALFYELKENLPSHVFDCQWPFELREIEHSLCEFDKYQRVKTGAGRPRAKYAGI